jgi:hypothetical protein
VFVVVVVSLLLLARCCCCCCTSVDPFVFRGSAILDGPVWYSDEVVLTHMIGVAVVDDVGVVNAVVVDGGAGIVVVAVV